MYETIYLWTCRIRNDLFRSLVWVLVSNFLSRSSWPQSGWMWSTCELASMGPSGCVTQGQSAICPITTAVLSWLFALGHCFPERSTVVPVVGCSLEQIHASPDYDLSLPEKHPPAWCCHHHKSLQEWSGDEQCQLFAKWRAWTSAQEVHFWANLPSCSQHPLNAVWQTMSGCICLCFRWFPSSDSSIKAADAWSSLTVGVLGRHRVLVFINVFHFTIIEKSVETLDFIPLLWSMPHCNFFTEVWEFLGLSPHMQCELWDPMFTGLCLETMSNQVDLPHVNGFVFI